MQERRGRRWIAEETEIPPPRARSSSPSPHTPRSPCSRVHSSPISDSMTSLRSSAPAGLDPTNSPAAAPRPSTCAVCSIPGGGIPASATVAPNSSPPVGAGGEVGGEADTERERSAPSARHARRGDPGDPGYPPRGDWRVGIERRGEIWDGRGGRSPFKVKICPCPLPLIPCCGVRGLIGANWCISGSNGSTA